jgi:prepilin signal peptidase PulO-like enzyme (type II secretory pathway)
MKKYFTPLLVILYTCIIMFALAKPLLFCGVVAILLMCFIIMLAVGSGVDAFSMLLLSLFLAMLFAALATILDPPPHLTPEQLQIEQAEERAYMLHNN